MATRTDSPASASQNPTGSDIDDAVFESLFTNGFGVVDTKERGRVQLIIETVKSKLQFHRDSTYEPSPNWLALPYIWQKKRKSPTNFFAELMMVNRIVSQELGYRSLLQFLSAKGWSYSSQGAKKPYVLEYRRAPRIEDMKVVGDAASSTEITTNMMAKISLLYKLLNRPQLCDPSTKKPFVNHLKLKSFKAKVLRYAQYLHIGYLILRDKILPFAPVKHTDEEYWLYALYGKLKEPRRYIQFLQNFLALGHYETTKDENPVTFPAYVKNLFLEHCTSWETPLRKAMMDVEREKMYAAHVDEQLTKCVTYSLVSQNIQADSGSCKESRDRFESMWKARLRDFSRDYKTKEIGNVIPSVTKNARKRKLQKCKMALRPYYILRCFVLLFTHPCSPCFAPQLPPFVLVTPV